MNGRNIDILLVVGLNIRKARHARGLSLSGLSTLMQVDRSDISRIENGKTNIGLRMLDNFREVLNVSITDLFDPAVVRFKSRK